MTDDTKMLLLEAELKQAETRADMAVAHTAALAEQIFKLQDAAKELMAENARKQDKITELENLLKGESK